MFKRLLFIFLALILSLSIYAETPTYKNVTRLYIATFHRTPDLEGLKYWIDNSGLELEGIAQSFFDQPETKETYPDTTDIDYFIKSVYLNLFDREPDSAGLEYWHEQLEKGYIKRGQFILAVINGALGDDKAKLTLSTYQSLEELHLALDMDSYFSKTGGRYYDGGVDNIIIDDINSANESVYMAVYQMTNRYIVAAIKDAYDRGVNVKIFTDDSSLDDDAFKELSDYGIDIGNDSDSYALMHDKFTIIDGKTLWTGSGNYTVYSFYRNNENYIRIEDSDIAKLYTDKFFALFNHSNKQIKPYQKDYTSVYFAPDYDLENIVIKRINQATKSINFLIFTFTDSDIADALVAARNRGVDVRGVFDESGNNYVKNYSQYEYLKNNGIDVSIDGNSFKLHDKVMIIDDNCTLTGSYNYTEKASDYNQENLIIIDRDDISLRYKSVFEKIYNLATNE